MLRPNSALFLSAILSRHSDEHRHVWRAGRSEQSNRLREVLLAVTRCCDSRSRCRWQRDRNARARGRFQRVLSITRLKQKAATCKPSSGSFRRSNGPLAQELPNDFLRVHWSVESQGYWLCAIKAAALSERPASRKRCKASSCCFSQL